MLHVYLGKCLAVLWHTPQKRVLINEISLWLCLFALFRASAKKYGDQNKNNNGKKHQHLYKNGTRC